MKILSLTLLLTLLTLISSLSLHQAAPATPLPQCFYRPLQDIPSGNFTYTITKAWTPQ